MKIQSLPEDKKKTAIRRKQSARVERNKAKLKEHEDVIAALVKFLKTSKGQRIVNEFDRYTLKELAMRYKCPLLIKYKNSSKCRNMFIAAAARAMVVQTPSNVKVIPNRRVKEMQKIGMLKLKPSLTKEEIKSINASRPSKKMGLAERLMRLECHKMNKWDKKSWPKIAKALEKRKKGDLFPDMFGEAMHNQLREAHLEEVRKQLSDKYCPVNITVITKSKDDVVQHKAFRKVKLGKLRSDKLDCNSKIGISLAKKLNNVMSDAQREFGADITCLHLNSHNHKHSVVLTPSQLIALAA